MRSLTRAPGPQQPPLNEAKLNEFMNKAVGDMGAAMHASLIAVGEQLGLYKAMGSGERMTSAELAKRTNTAERYVREWLNAQAASGYANYDPGDFHLLAQSRAGIRSRQ